MAVSAIIYAICHMEDRVVVNFGLVSLRTVTTTLHNSRYYYYYYHSTTRPTTVHCICVFMYDILELRAVFSVFDVDKDGFITVEEVIKVLESMNFPPSRSSIDDIFRQVDLDGSDTVCRLFLC